MCNTFGGIIFLAISLIVIAAMLPKPTSLEAQNLKSAEDMAKEIRKLELESQRLAAETTLKSDILKRMANDPRLEGMTNIAELEREIREQQQSLAIEKIKLEQVELARTAQQALLEKSREQVEKEESTRKKREQELAKIVSAIASLRKSLAKAPKQLVCRKMRSAALSEQPYFVIVRSGKCWRVGPPAANGDLSPHDDVKTNRDQNYFECVPDESKGSPILHENVLSTTTIAILKSLPPNRFLHFQLYPDSAAEFFRLAESLKSQSINYHVTFKKTGESAGFSVVEEASHEY
jgi:hypothetical protein